MAVRPLFVLEIDRAQGNKACKTKRTNSKVTYITLYHSVLKILATVKLKNYLSSFFCYGTYHQCYRNVNKSSEVNRILRNQVALWMIIEANFHNIRHVKNRETGYFRHQIL